jgi:hypothetical protein
MPDPVVVQGAALACAAGSSAGTLTVTSQAIVNIGGLAVATVADHAAGTNVAPFGNCALLSVINGAPTPCAPVLPAPWAPGSAVQKIAGLAVLTQPSVLQCGVGAAISITAPGQAVEASA